MKDSGYNPEVLTADKALENVRAPGSIKSPGSGLKIKYFPGNFFIDRKHAH